MRFGSCGVVLRVCNGNGEVVDLVGVKVSKSGSMLRLRLLGYGVSIKRRLIGFVGQILVKLKLGSNRL